MIAGSVLAFDSTALVAFRFMGEAHVERGRGLVRSARGAGRQNRGALSRGNDTGAELCQSELSHVRDE